MSNGTTARGLVTALQRGSRPHLLSMLALMACTTQEVAQPPVDAAPAVEPPPTLATVAPPAAPDDGLGPMPVHEPIGVGFMGPMGSPIPMATPEQLAAFKRGEKLARRRFTPEDGLGPQFNGVSCLSCHERPVLGGGAELYRNLSMAGVFKEGKGYVLSPLELESREIAVSDGVMRTYNIDDYGGPAQQPIQKQVGLMASRNPVAFFGSGVIMSIPVEAIEALADPDDLDGDGVSGRPNIDAHDVGRLGTKSMGAGHTSMLRIDLYVHMGLSLPLPTEASNEMAPFPDQLTGTGIFKSDPTDPVEDPEITAEEYFDLLSWVQLLAAPQFDPLDRVSGHGRDLFDAIGCTACHTPRLPSPYGPVPAYTDFLLHDMGPDLWDGYVMDYSHGAEFKTAALWGVAATAPYLHDGRAKTLDEAIRWHAGEAAHAHDGYVALSGEDQRAVVAFLRTLGGASLASDGLLPPNTPLKPAGELGGPLPGLSPEQIAAFTSGRAMFDYAFGMSQGVGNPAFNGDSCRGCHSDPVIGGSGPLDVNVLRMGNVDEAGVAHSLPEGNVVHRMLLFETKPIRPPKNANVIEMRQTPSLFGAGLIEGISDETIVANADPDDLRPPLGISGRPGMTAEGRVCRFGWKALVPTLYEFTESAMTDEMGLTVPFRTRTDIFGAQTDDDKTPDPEVSVSTIQSIVTFIANLAPPPRGEITPAATAGAEVFDRVGCDDCHMPSLAGASGPVNLYSDLLLHEILPPGTRGIVQGVAGQTEFRTPPLWGVSHTGPFLHTGRATTLDAAIRAHDGEGTAARAAYVAASAEDRQNLIAFLNSL